MEAFLLGLAWKSVAVLSVAWGAAWALRSQSAALRHLIWASAFAALLLLPVLSAALPALTMPVEIPVGELLSSTTAVAPASTASAPAPGSFDGGVNTGAHASAAWRLPRWSAIVTWAWIGGTLAGVLQLIVALVVLWRMRRAARRIDVAPVHGAEVLELRSGEMPSSFGRSVFLPASASAWPAARRNAVLLHELAHVDRRDSTVQIMARLALSAYWWNPLAWFAWRELIDAREQAADDAVLSSGVAASDYANHLLEIARELRDGGLASPVLVGMARQSKLEVRMKAILDVQRDRRVPGRVTGLFVAAAAVAMILPVAALRAQSAEDLPADIDAMMRAAVMQKNAEALENMAMRAADLAKYDVSIKLMKSALEVRTQTSGAQSKEYAQSLMMMGRLQWRKGDDASRQTFVKAEEMLKDLPESAEALIHLAFTEISVKNYEQAERMLEKAASLDAKSAARARMWIGVIRERQGKQEDADFLYRSAHSLAAPDSEEAATILEVHSQMLKGMPDKAEEAGVMNGKALAYRKARGLEQVAKRPVSAGTRKIGGEVKAPSVLSKVEPAYSQEARLARYQGAVVASIEIGTDGTPQNVRIVRGLGLGLSEKAIDAIQQWKFKPGTVNGEPVPVQATIEVNFRLL